LLNLIERDRTMKKTILITGASSGIGKASTELFASKGWNVVATMRAPDPALATGDVLVTRLDVQDPASIAQAIDAGVARFGRIDVLFNNAGYGEFGIFESTPPDKVRQQFDVNVFGVMDVTRAVLPHFRANKAGMVINTSSGAGMFTLPLISLYCASKFALEGFTEALSYELASQNIGVKLVIPHGGVASTRFNARTFADAATQPKIADYDAFVADTQVAFGRMLAARMMDATEVAQVAYTAATDGTDQLRYLVGDDARGFVKARRAMSEPDYTAFMRAHFKTVA
jgi:NAD(P)-dependent dehydrogenase (short-subunit alcohol dehydrogenase family)